MQSRTIKVTRDESGAYTVTDDGPLVARYLRTQAGLHYYKVVDTGKRVCVAATEPIEPVADDATTTTGASDAPDGEPPFDEIESKDEEPDPV